MGAGGIGIAAEMHQLLRFMKPQIGQQVHLSGLGKLVLGHIGHDLSPPPGIKKGTNISVRASSIFRFQEDETV